MKKKNFFPFLLFAVAALAAVAVLIYMAWDKWNLPDYFNRLVGVGDGAQSMQVTLQETQDSMVPGDSQQGTQETLELSQERLRLAKENMGRLTLACTDGKDCIPSIDAPVFVNVLAATFLEPSDTVIGLEYQAETRAYPVKILNWHEVVNDTIAGVPVVVTWCPLAASAVAFDRRMEDQTLIFGVSGYLLNSNLVMYDRETDTRWSQLTGGGLTGPMTGETLTMIPVHVMPWSDWKKLHPQTRVLSTQTGFERDYEAYPYGDYQATEDLYSNVSHQDGRLKNKEQVFGVQVFDKFRAYPLAVLLQKYPEPEGGEFEDTIGGHTVVVSYRHGVLKVMSMEQPENASVEPVEIIPLHAYWFAWVAFHPDTEVL